MGNTAERVEQIPPEQQTLYLLFVGRTRRMTQDAAFGGMQWVQGQNLGEILRGSGTERTSGGRSRPRKTERVVRARIESLEVHQTKSAFERLLLIRKLEISCSGRRLDDPLSQKIDTQKTKS